MAKASKTETAKGGVLERISSRAKEPSAKTPAKAPKASKSAPKRRNVAVRFVAYIGNVRSELRRVVWPTRTEVVNASAVVIVTLIFFTLVTALVDYTSAFIFIDVLTNAAR